MSAGRSAPLARRPALAAITLEQGGDGVAYAGLLLDRALRAIDPNAPRALELSPATQGAPTRLEQVRFTGRIVVSQLVHSRDAWLFNHVGIARAQNVARKFVARPYAVLLCGIEVWDPQLTSDRKDALRNASARIAISNYTRARVAAQHPDVGPIVSCPLALLPAANASAPQRDRWPSVRDSSVLIVGRMSSAERYKGHDELLEGWSRVLESVPNAQLVIAGRGDDVARLQTKAADLGIAASVLFLGFVPDDAIAALRARATIFALPSRGEGFGLVYLEAMRAGLPCIGGADDAAADVIVDGETGLLVDPRKLDALATAIVTLLRSPELRARYGAAGKRRFEAEFTFERYVSRLRPILAAAFS